MSEWGEGLSQKALLVANLLLVMDPLLLASVFHAESDQMKRTALSEVEHKKHVLRIWKTYFIAHQTLITRTTVLRGEGDPRGRYSDFQSVKYLKRRFPAFFYRVATSASWPRVPYVCVRRVVLSEGEERSLEA